MREKTGNKKREKGNDYLEKINGLKAISGDNRTVVSFGRKKGDSREKREEFFEVTMEVGERTSKEYASKHE